MPAFVTIGARMISSWLSGGTPPEKGSDASCVCCRMRVCPVWMLAGRQRRAGCHGVDTARLGGRSDPGASPRPGSNLGPGDSSRSWWAWEVEGRPFGKASGTPYARTGSMKASAFRALRRVLGAAVPPLAARAPTEMPRAIDVTGDPRSAGVIVLRNVHTHHSFRQAGAMNLDWAGCLSSRAGEPQHRSTTGPPKDVESEQIRDVVDATTGIQLWVDTRRASTHAGDAVEARSERRPTAKKHRAIHSSFGTVHLQ